MAVVRKKQDDKCLEALRDLINTGGNGGGGGNRQCFDCGQRGPTYVNMTIGSFVCTRCSGVLRGLTPPHRVKSISMATFTPKEIEFLKAHGNDVCAKTWLGLWDPKRIVPQEQRDLMIDKYERKRYYLEPASPLKALTNTTSVKSSIAPSNNNTNNNKNNIINNNHSSQNNVQSNGPSNLQRTTANGLHNTITNGGVGATETSDVQSIAPIKPITHMISRPQTQFQQNQQLIKSNNTLNSNNSNKSYNHRHLTDDFGLPNGFGNTSTSNTFNSEIPKSDFVADFNVANIYNATAYKMPSTTIGGTTVTTNSNAKVQPKSNESNKINFFNNNNQYHQTNGNGLTMHTNTTTDENFADFEHAPIIYNAPGLTTITSFVNDNKRDFNHHSNSNNNNNKMATIGVTPSEDRYAALKDLDDQLRESKAVAAAAAAAKAIAPSVMNNNLISPCNSIYNGQSNNNTNCNGINPLDTIAQEQQQQLYNPFKHLNGTVMTTTTNTINNNTTNGNLFGQMTLIPHNMSSGAATTTNGLIETLKSQTNKNFFNYATTASVATAKTNGYHYAFLKNDNDETMDYCNGGHSNIANDECRSASSDLYNGSSTTTTVFNNFFYCPLTKRMAAAAAATTGNNPFATTNAIQSNNPFL